MSRPESEHQTPAGPAQQEKNKSFVVFWLIALGVIGVVLGFSLPLFVDSPPYPERPGTAQPPAAR